MFSDMEYSMHQSLLAGVLEPERGVAAPDLEPVLTSPDSAAIE